MPRQRVFITGIGCVSSFGGGVRARVDALMAGTSGIAPIARFDTSSCRSHRAALIQGFDPTTFIPPLKLRRMDEASRIALVCARQTFEDAAWPVEPSQPADRVGIALGTYTA